MRFSETHVHILQIDETHWDRHGHYHSGHGNQAAAAFVASTGRDDAWGQGMAAGTTTGWDGTDAGWSDVS